MQHLAGLDQPVTPWVYVALGNCCAGGKTCAACDYMHHGLSLTRRENKASGCRSGDCGNLQCRTRRSRNSLYGPSTCTRETYHMPLSPLDHLEYDALMASLNANPTVDWEACWLKGAALSRSEVTQIIIDGTRSLDNFA